jgi:hypothetical protein
MSNISSIFFLSDLLRVLLQVLSDNFPKCAQFNAVVPS